MSGHDEGPSFIGVDVPDWIVWQQRPFPDANLLLLDGATPALVDSGYRSHAAATAAWVARRTRDLSLVVNTHWHSDHVGGNAMLQQRGVGIAASATDAEALNGAGGDCCLSTYLDQPVDAYAVDQPLTDGDVVSLGDADWQVVATPGHTPGHLVFWQPEEHVLAVGDLLSTYDVGWVNLALDGPEAGAAALASLRRVADLRPRTLLPAHGALPPDVPAALDAALRRAQRLVDDPAGAVWYGARRIFAFALMIRHGIPIGQVEDYLLARDWVLDAARLLDLDPTALADELVTTMIRSGAVAVSDGQLRATIDYSL